jgi:type III pantothenate kinase
MILAIDIGNTHTVLGVYREDTLEGNWRFYSDHTRTADECGVLISHVLRSIDVEFDQISGAVIASVVPPLTSVFEEMSNRYIKRKPVVVRANLPLGISIGCEEPKRLGADRIANAVGAFERYGGPTIVVDLGTATTFDVITADGVYVGGVIAPGMETSAAQLFHKAAQLPRVEVAKPLKVIGTNTEDSLRAGIFYSSVGCIDEIVRRIERELGVNVRVVATGGLAALVSEESETIEVVEPFLTLDGLRLIFERSMAERTRDSSSHTVSVSDNS